MLYIETGSGRAELLRSLTRVKGIRDWEYRKRRHFYAASVCGMARMQDIWVTPLSKCERVYGLGNSGRNCSGSPDWHVLLRGKGKGKTVYLSLVMRQAVVANQFFAQ